MSTIQCFADVDDHQGVEPSKAIYPDVPEEVLEQGWIEALKYVRILKEQGRYECYTVRVQLMGGGTAGKTSVIRAIQRGGVTDPIEADDRTVGINLEEMKLGERVTAVVYDMAGQQDYDIVHSAFICDRCGTGGGCVLGYNTWWQSGGWIKVGEWGCGEYVLEGPESG